ncbi:MCE family protein [Amycolatopsis nigrescens]|uniref:MCE family protein n=1 Tax=Amycolatopsis nigrescens TaxID=381445 RepID=UPI0004782F7E|nr:MCE family protein [Amycolatopsis nigrescens]
MKTLKEYNPVWVGLFGAMLIGALVAASLIAGFFGIGDERYQAEFQHTGGIRAGDEVRVAGMSVGKVTATELAGDRVLVSFRLTRDVRLGPTTHASIKLATLLGGRYVELQPLGEGELPEERIPLAATSVPFDLQKVIETGGPAIEQLDGAKLRDSLKVLADSFRGTPQQVGETLDGLGQLSELVTAREGQLRQLLDGADAVTTMLNDNRAQLFTLMGQADGLLKQLLHRRDLIRNVLTDFRTLTGQLKDILNENRPQLEPLLANLSGVTDVLQRNDDAVGRSLELLAPAGRYLANTFGNGPYAEIYLPYAIIPDNLLCASGVVKGCK